MAEGLIGSEILRIAAEIRALKAQGQTCCTSPSATSPPRSSASRAARRAASRAALARGETNYPPSNGVVELREAVRALLRARARARLSARGVLDRGRRAARSSTATYRALVRPRRRASSTRCRRWNNNHYVHLVGARRRAGRLHGAEDALPAHAPSSSRRTLRGRAPARARTRRSTRPAPRSSRGRARAAICRSSCSTRTARAAQGRAPALRACTTRSTGCSRFGETRARHAARRSCRRWRPTRSSSTASARRSPRPACASAWAVGPARRHRAHVGHARPRRRLGAAAEQVATAALLDDADGHRRVPARASTPASRRRLDVAARGLPAAASAGPAGATASRRWARSTSTARVHPFGQRTPDGARSRDQRRRAAVPAGGGRHRRRPVPGVRRPRGDDGWFRCSVGAVGSEQIERAMGAPRVRSQRAVVSTAASDRRRARKDAAAAAAVALVTDGMLVGLGTGSTAALGRETARREGARRPRDPRRPHVRGDPPPRRAEGIPLAPSTTSTPSTSRSTAPTRPIRTSSSSRAAAARSSARRWSRAWRGGSS